VLKRLLLVLSLGWAACCIGAELANNTTPAPHVWLIAFLPLVLSFALLRAGRFVVKGQ
jgi:hypothetical protein